MNFALNFEKLFPVKQAGNEFHQLMGQLVGWLTKKSAHCWSAEVLGTREDSRGWRREYLQLHSLPPSRHHPLFHNVLISFDTVFLKNKWLPNTEASRHNHWGSGACGLAELGRRLGSAGWVSFRTAGLCTADLGAHGVPLLPHLPSPSPSDGELQETHFCRGGSRGKGRKKKHVRPLKT